VRFVKCQGAVPGIQIAHAGRKASADRPWQGDDHIPPNDPRAWDTLAPSPLAFGANLARVPREMMTVAHELLATAGRSRGRLAAEAWQSVRSHRHATFDRLRDFAGPLQSSGSPHALSTART
jgi:hypothetical protein